MEIIKTIFRLSFFVLGCIMLSFSILVIPVGITSFIWFFSFAVLFFLLGHKITFAPLYKKYGNIKKGAPVKNQWIVLNNENIVYNESFKELKLNEKLYRYSQIVSVDLFANNKKTTESELNKLEKIKSIEIKIGVKINKVAYKKFKYINTKDSDKEKKSQRKKALSDYNKLTKVLKIKVDKEEKVDKKPKDKKKPKTKSKKKVTKK